VASCAAAPAAVTGLVRARESSLLELFRVHAPAFERSQPLTWNQRRFLRAVQVCRTAALGGHVYACDRCEHRVPVYNSCCNRHCPACQALDQARWIRKREKRLLPVGHHHVVFTLPAELRLLARRHPRVMHGLLFQAMSTVLKNLARARWHARLGVTAVLHTWTRTLAYHPHVHCIVTAGGLHLDEDRWVDQRRYLFPVNEIKCAFARLVREGLRERSLRGDLTFSEPGVPSPEACQRLLESLPKWRRWVVHIEPPFGRSTHVLKYLGRYTHRVAISDARVESITDDAITFRTRGDDRLTLPAHEFIRRFVQHVLPRGFHKIRHFGLYASPKALARAATVLGDGDSDLDPPTDDDKLEPTTWIELLRALGVGEPLACPRCQRGHLHLVDDAPRSPRGPP